MVRRRYNRKALASGFSTVVVVALAAAEHLRRPEDGGADIGAGMIELVLLLAVVVLGLAAIRETKSSGERGRWISAGGLAVVAAWVVYAFAGT